MKKHLTAFGQATISLVAIAGVFYVFIIHPEIIAFLVLALIAIAVYGGLYNHFFRQE